MVNRKSKNVIITGGARGIGRATARYLLSQPLAHRVFLIDVDDDELEYAASKHLSAYAPRVGFATANLRNPEEIRTAVSKAADFFGGRIDVLVNNAGIARAFFTAGNGTMEDPATAEQWQAYIDTNLSAPFWMSQAVIPFMKAQNPKIEGKGTVEQKGVDRENDIKRREEFSNLPDDLHGKDKSDEGGCILHISSFRAHQSDPDCEGYGTTKAGLLGLTQAMAVSCQRWGIRVNMVSPGWVSVAHECKDGDEAATKTEGAPHEDDAVKARLETWASDHTELHHRQHLVGRVGQGEDIAEAIDYAMGAGFLDGQVRYRLSVEVPVFS
jgi:NAD(P)-dependent dehydrogenase (short-subunit alcohol dehydrogenase family)